MSRVLAVDDDPDILALLAVTLRNGGHVVDVASSADEAMVCLRRSPVDVVLLDVMMPGRDGWSLLEEIKDDEALTEIPVIMVTARGEQSDRFRGGLGGALVYVTKPFRPSALLEVVAEVLAGEAPEPERRRAVQRESLSGLASLESGRDRAGASPRLAALSQSGEPPKSVPSQASVKERLGRLTEGQLSLLTALVRADSVAAVALQRKVSRSNVYASLRRIHRKMGTSSVEDLVLMARQAGLLE